MIRIPVSRYLLTNGVRPKRASGFKGYCLSRVEWFGFRRILTGGTFMANSGLETSYTWD